MCQMRVIVLREMLGNRETGWTLWDGKQVMEMTSKQIKDTITKGNKVCGLKVGASGELERDEEGFYCTNIMQHRHCNSYEPMVEGGMANLFYICIGSHEENGSMFYDCISTRFEQLKIAEAEMRAYLKIGIVSAGVKEIDGKLVVADLEFKKPVAEEEKGAVAEVSKEAGEVKVTEAEPKPTAKQESKPVAKASTVNKK